MHRPDAADQGDCRAILSADVMHPRACPLGLPSPSVLSSSAELPAASICASAQGEYASATPEITIHAQTNLSNQFNPILPVQSHRQKYSPSLPTQITSISLSSRSTEGRIAIVTDAERDVMDADCIKRADGIAGRLAVSDRWRGPTDDAIADGEVVWS
jgi:hypothetical protein